MKKIKKLTTGGLSLGYKFFWILYWVCDEASKKNMPDVRAQAMTQENRRPIKLINVIQEGATITHINFWNAGCYSVFGALFMIF